MSGLLPGATWVQNARNAGGTYVDGYPARIVLHTIEGALGTLSASLPASHPYCPHLWYDPSTRRLYQTVPLDRSAFALYQGDGPYTNKARALQVEIAGRAESAGEWPDAYLVNLARDVVVPLVKWAATQGWVIDLDHVPPIGAIGGSASEHAPQRMSYEAWTAFDGLASHRHVPDNDHWDTGTLNVNRVVQLAKELLGTYGTASPPERWSTAINANRMDLCGAAPDGRVMHQYADVRANGGRWSKWSAIGGLLTDETPSIVWHQDWLHFYAVERGTGRVMQCSWNDTNKGWFNSGAWYPVAGAGPVATGVSAAVGL